MEILYSCPLLINSYVFAYVGPPASRYQQLAAPSSVYQRSLACDLEWPRYSSVSREERELGLAYVITAFSDPRNLLRQGSARDGPLGERPQSFNPCLELTLKLVATHPPPPPPPPPKV